MRIGIDGRVLVGKLSGTGRYMFELCRQLDVQMPEAEFFVYGPGVIARPAENERWHYRVDALPGRMKPVVWLKLRVGPRARWDRLDVFWGGTHFLPHFLPSSMKTVLTVHDLVYQICPDTMTFFHRYSHKLFFPSDLRRASKVVANSFATSERLRARFGKAADAVVTPGVSDSWGRKSLALVAESLQRLGIAKNFLLAVSTIEPRKNYKAMINAFVSLKREGWLSDFELVIVGGPGWKCEDDVNLIKASAPHGVRWLGFVTDADLQCLYSGTRLYVCSSIYEGFGIPALEAVACGTPALLSDIPELREAGGKSAKYTAPDEIGFKTGILESVRNDPPAVKQLERSLPTWSVGAATMRDVFHSTMAENPNTRKISWTL